MFEIKKIVNHYRVHVIQRLEGDVCSLILFLPVASGGGGDRWTVTGGKMYEQDTIIPLT